MLWKCSTRNGNRRDGALISYIDLSQGKQAIVGLTSGATSPSDDQPEPASLAADEPAAEKNDRLREAADSDCAIKAALKAKHRRQQ